MSCCDAFGSGGGGGGPGECCTLADTLIAGNTTGGSSIVVSTGDGIAGQTDLPLGAADDVLLAPIAGSAYVGTGPIVTGGANAGVASDANVFSGQTVPGPNGSILGFRRLTAGANVTITEGVDDITIAAAGGAAATWAATLVAGNTSGGTDPIISTGDVLLGQTDLSLLAGGNAGNWTGAAADASGANNGGQTILRSGSGGGGNDGGFLDIFAGNGDGAGSGGRMWARGGQGGPTNGQGGVGRISGGQGTGAGDGGLGLLEGGPATSGQGGFGRVAGGSSNGSPGVGQVHGGSSLVAGPGADAEVAGGLPATVGQGGSVRLIPRAGVGGGATGVATVGAEAIITTCSSAGAGASTVRSKNSGTVNGANQTFRSLTSVGGTVTIVEGADTINLEAAAGFSSGAEIGIDVQGVGLVASTVRQTVVRGRQIGATQVSFNLGAGTAVVALQYRSLTAGQVTTARARNIWGRSNLGNTFLAGLTTVVNTNLNTFTTIISITVDAGNWVICSGVDLEPPP